MYNFCVILPVFHQKFLFSHVNISEIPTPNAKKASKPTACLLAQ